MNFPLDRNVLIRFLWINFLLQYLLTLDRLSAETSKFPDNIPQVITQGRLAVSVCGGGYGTEKVFTVFPVNCHCFQDLIKFLTKQYESKKQYENTSNFHMVLIPR